MQNLNLPQPEGRKEVECLVTEVESYVLRTPGVIPLNLGRIPTTFELSISPDGFIVPF